MCRQGVFWKSVGGAEMGLLGAKFVRFWTDFRQPGAQKSSPKGRNPPIGGKKYTLVVKEENGPFVTQVKSEKSEDEDQNEKFQPARNHRKNMAMYRRMKQRRNAKKGKRKAFLHIPLICKIKMCLHFNNLLQNTVIQLHGKIIFFVSVTPRQKTKLKCCALGKKFGRKVEDRETATCNKFARKVSHKTKMNRFICHVAFGKCCVKSAREHKSQ